MTFKKEIALVLYILFPMLTTHAQDVSISLGKSDIALNQFYEITITVKNDKLKSYSNFPSIPGFSDMGNSTSTNYSFINGRQSSSYSLTKRYKASREGTFLLKDFTMTINGKKINSKGAKITVGPAQQRRQSRFSSPFFNDPFFDDPFSRNRQPQKLDFIEIDDDAFFHVSVNKNEIYRGEGVLLTFSMYIPSDQYQLLNFKDNIAEQIAELKDKAIPKYCIEENFPITQIERQQTEVKGKPYMKFDLYQSMIYPVNTEDILIPSLPLDMIKYQVSKQTDVFGRRQTKSDSKKFYSRKQTIKVKELPPHPLRQDVSVGQFQLKEEIDTQKLEVGNSFNYTFSIWGRGNIANINLSEINNDDNLEFFHPDVTQKIERGMGTVTGHKSFNYNALVNEPGNFPLSKYFQWIYFDPVEEKYDTLVATKKITATGESVKNAAIESNEFDGIYSNMQDLSNKVIIEGEGDNFTIFANIGVVIMSLGMLIILIRRRKKKHG